MKKTIIKVALFLAIIFSLQACSTPEERATTVDGADSTNTTTSATTDSMNANLEDTKNGPDSGSSMKAGDSTTSNKKMKSFRHTPIDTITSLQDSSKH